MSVVNWEDSAEETLSELISYKLPASKSGAIASRRFAQWSPAGSNVYGPASGTRSMRFVLAGDQGFLLPDTLQLKCKAKAASGTNVSCDIGLAACFTRYAHIPHRRQPKIEGLWVPPETGYTGHSR